MTYLVSYLVPFGGIGNYKVMELVFFMSKYLFMCHLQELRVHINSQFNKNVGDRINSTTLKCLETKERNNKNVEYQNKWL